jgi:hypothetical protein
VVCGVWCGVGYVGCGAWCVVCGVWCVVCGVWCECLVSTSTSTRTCSSVRFATEGVTNQKVTTYKAAQPVLGRTSGSGSQSPEGKQSLEI